MEYGVVELVFAMMFELTEQENSDNRVYKDARFLEPNSKEEEQNDQDELKIGLLVS